MMYIAAQFIVAAALRRHSAILGRRDRHRRIKLPYYSGLGNCQRGEAEDRGARLRRTRHE